MKNKLPDLNNILFEQLDRLNHDELKGDALKTEIERSRSVTQVSTQIIANAKLILDAEIAKSEYNLKIKPDALSTKLNPLPLEHNKQGVNV